MFIVLQFTAAVRRNKLLAARATRAEVESVVKLWLRYASDRGGGRHIRLSSSRNRQNRESDTE